MHLQIVGVLLVVALAACTPEKDPAIPALSESVKQLQSQLAQAHADSEKLTLRVNMLELREKWAQDTSTMLDVTDKGYSVAKTNLGELLFSVQDMTPYGNGVKLKLLIGNPGMVTYDGAKLKIRWGKALDWSQPNMDYAAWQNGLKTKEISLPNTLLPGTWNPVEVILAPAKPDETGYLSVDATLNSLRLRPVAYQ